MYFVIVILLLLNELQVSLSFTRNSLKVTKLFTINNFIGPVEWKWEGKDIYSQSSQSSCILNAFITHYEELSVPTLRGVSLIDITQGVKDIIKKTDCKEGIVTILSKHSTVSVTINEMEGRLVDDTRQFLLKLAPPEHPYLHNDLDFRVGPSNWPGGDVAWRAFRATQPTNAHSHLIALLLGTSETIPIHQGEMKIGQYQNIIIVDADGPKNRSMAIQITGTN